MTEETIPRERVENALQVIEIHYGAAAADMLQADSEAEKRSAELRMQALNPALAAVAAALEGSDPAESADISDGTVHGELIRIGREVRDKNGALGTVNGTWVDYEERDTE